MYLVVKVKSKTNLVIGSLSSFFLTYCFCFQAVIRKWDLRIAMASNAEQFESATADGANKLFTAFISAPFESLFWTLLWGYIWMRLFKIRFPGYSR